MRLALLMAVSPMPMALLRRGKRRSNSRLMMVKTKFSGIIVLWFLFSFFTGTTFAQNISTNSFAAAPVIPLGLDAYRQWAHWPYQRIGMRAYMRSTYDRTGGNEGGDASHFLYQLADDNNVTLDVEGPGVLYFARYNHWHGSPWHYVVDGTDHLIQESSTADPTHPSTNSIFLPADLFPSPLAFTWSATKGADLLGAHPF